VIPLASPNPQLRPACIADQSVLSPIDLQRRTLRSWPHQFFKARGKMDHAQARALSALQPFIHLALTTSSPTPRFLADLITRATSVPGAFIFTELLQTPAIQSLRSADTPPEFQAYLTVLEIFSYGTFDEYKSELPILTIPQKFILTPETKTPRTFPP
jgi:hypothetical protein